MTMILLIILFASLVIILSVLVGREIYIRSVSGLHDKDYRPLSYPSRQIAKSYHKLPKDNRPYGELIPILKALDVNHPNVKRHFMKMGYDRSFSSMSITCIGPCAYEEYHQLYDSLTSIHIALNEQRRGFEVAAVAEGLSNTQDMIKALQEEAKAIKAITREVLS